MKKFIIIFSLLYNFSFCLNNPDLPVEPEVDEDFSTELPEIENPFKEINTNSTIYFIKTKLFFPDKTTKEEILIFSNLNSLSITNNEDTKKVYTFSLYQIGKIEIIKWKATNLSNNLYLFLPDRYKVYLKDETVEPFEIIGNIGLFNVLTASSEEKTKKFYTIFYDHWISGKNKYFRWKNSKSVVFDYNLTKPLPDVVVKIEFLW